MAERVEFPLRQVPALAAGTAHVWFAGLADVPLLDPPDRDRPETRADRLRRMRVREKFLLRLLLGAYLGVPGRDVGIVRNANGKPSLAPPHAESGLEFNLSHADEKLAIAVARSARVGIDIEPAGRELRWRRLARRWFDAVEVERLERLDPLRARLEFLERWTTREAIIKAVGETIAGHIADVVLDVEDTTRPVVLPESWPAPEDWRVIAIDTPDLIARVASPDGVEDVRAFELAGPEAG
ncbi:MAG: 4'-phosphopantetheinyl transferase superfamily protein [Wenzhouxiangellaceae bacterium]|nr:4'-phosphopantetheinyl transferase superfamily protein [Wenzhouxiangellaceae bacterium]